MSFGSSFRRHLICFPYFALLIGWMTNTLAAQTAPIQKVALPVPEVTALLQDQSGFLWVGTPYGLYRYDGHTFEHFHHQPFDLRSLRDNRVTKLLEDVDGHLWIITEQGVDQFDPDTQRFLPNANQQNVSPNGATTHHLQTLLAAQTQQQQSWDQELQKLRLSHPLPTNLNATSLTSLLFDKTGNLWLGTATEGLYHWPLTYQYFRQENKTASLSTAPLSALCATTSNGPWWADHEQQIWYWDHSRTTAPKEFPLDSVTIHCIHQAKDGTLWLGGTKYLYQISLQRTAPQVIQRFAILEDQDVIVDIYEDQQGQLWLLTPNYFGLFDQTEGIFYGLLYHEETRPSAQHYLSANIYQSPDGTFWLGTDEGLKTYRQGATQFKHLPYGTTANSSLSSPLVSGIVADPAAETLWISTQGGGLNRYEPATNTFEYYTTDDGLPTNALSNLTFDAQGQLWITSHQGLTRFNPQTGSCQHFTTAHGLLDNQLADGLLSSGKDSVLWIGSPSGLNGFSPAKLMPDTSTYTLRLRDVILHSDGKAQHLAILDQNEVTIPTGVTQFSLSFSAMDLSFPHARRFRFRLGEKMSIWQETGHYPMIYFQELAPGRHQLALQTTDEVGNWVYPPHTLTLVLPRAWWQSWWAYLLYGSGIVLLAYAVYRILLNRQLERSEARQLKKMDRMRARLYTNITHE
ncbi:MAG: two-component regulator propeller domain-containing protein, partial [Bacteroidota bacterium]